MYRNALARPREPPSHSEGSVGYEPERTIAMIAPAIMNGANGIGVVRSIRRAARMEPL
jgi:hypothetical protein